MEDLESSQNQRMLGEPENFPEKYLKLTMKTMDCDQNVGFDE